MRTRLLCAVLPGLLCHGPLAAADAAADLKLPPVELPKDRISALSRMQIKSFRFTGNTVFSDETLLAQIKGYQRSISAEELQEVRNILTRYYIEAGYINSGALIPDQEIQDQQVLIQIVEGHLTQINLQNQDSLRLRESYLTRRLAFDDTQPLNTNTLQERLQILQQNPLIRRFNAELGPGIQAGEAVLNLEITEERPYEFGLTVNNHRSPSVGSLALEGEARHRNLTGWGDSLYVRTGLTEGINEYSLEYILPITRHDTTLELSAERSDSNVISTPFNELDITSQAETYALRLRHPFLKSYQNLNYRVFDMGLGLEKRRSETGLLGLPFDFSPGVQEGVSKITALRFSQNWLDRSRNRVVAVASTFGFGIDALDATINDGFNAQTGAPTVEPDSRFTLWLGQFRWIERLPTVLDSQLWLRADFQYSRDPLLPLEKFVIGGASSVRGYRENQLTRDKGMVLSLEWQVPLPGVQLRIPKLSTQEGDGAVFLAPFIDYGWGKNHDVATPTPTHIASVGLGVIWAINRQLRTELYWGHPLRQLEKPEDYDWQDDGLHFSLQAHF